LARIEVVNAGSGRAPLNYGVNMRKCCRKCFAIGGAIASAIAFLVLTGCNKPAEGGGSTTPVGEFASLTGKEAAFGNSSHKGTLLASEDVNKAGGVLGKKVELITEDTRSTPGESATVVRKLISRNKVVAVLGEVASGRSLEGASVCQPSKVPMI